MVNRANGTRVNDHRANGIRADVVAPEKLHKDAVEPNEMLQFNSLTVYSISFIYILIFNKSC